MTESVDQVAVLETLQLRCSGPDRVEIASIRARSVNLHKVHPGLIVREADPTAEDRWLEITLIVTPPRWQFWRKRTEIRVALHSTPNLALPEIPLAHYATPLTDAALLGYQEDEYDDDDQ